MGKFKKTLVSAAKADLAQEQETKTPPEEASCRGRGASDRRAGQSAEIFCPVSGKHDPDRGNDSLLLAAIGLVALVYPEDPGSVVSGTVQIGQELFMMLR